MTMAHVDHLVMYDSTYLTLCQRLYTAGLQPVSKSPLRYVLSSSYVSCRCHACVIGYCTVGNVYAYFLQFGCNVPECRCEIIYFEAVGYSMGKTLQDYKLSQIVDFWQMLESLLLYYIYTLYIYTNK